MCGINGFVRKDLSEIKNAEQLLVSMNSKIVHRGPDENGYYHEKKDGFEVGMAMQRLSIIDLSTGKQPIFSSDRNKVIVFNGEIYNYEKLRLHLLELGETFDTTSDTEVVIKLFDKYGVDSFSMLDGMFGLSIYDKVEDKIYIARDFFGEKPLYYTKTKSSFYWGSELKSIIEILDKKPEISLDGIDLYFKLTYIPAPFSIYEGIFKLEPYSYIELDCSTLDYSIHKIKEKKFKDYKGISKKEAISINHDLVLKNVESRSVADVKVGTFLSGGVDSSIVSLCLSKLSSKKIDTFSIGFESKDFDESSKAKMVAKLIDSNHHQFMLKEDDLKNDLDLILLNFDEPFADSSSLATYFVSNKTKKLATVALTGDGGDEVYGGYNKYYVGKLNTLYTKTIPHDVHDFFSNIINKISYTREDNRGIRFKINRLLQSIDYDDKFYYNIISLGFQDKERESLFVYHKNKSCLDYFYDQIPTPKTLKDFRNIDRIMSLEGDMLVKVDRTSMLNSLECRAPFLNQEIWDFTHQLPDNFLMNRWDKKHLLKESFKDYFPDGFLNKSKKGFGVPVGNWLRSSLKDELLSYVDLRFIEKQKIFNYDVVSKLVYSHLEGKIDNTFRVWTFFCFQKWYINTYSV